MKIAPSFLYTLENATLIIIRCCDEEVGQTDLAVSALVIRCDTVSTPSYVYADLYRTPRVLTFCYFKYIQVHCREKFQDLTCRIADLVRLR